MADDNTKQDLPEIETNYLSYEPVVEGLVTSETNETIEEPGLPWDLEEIIPNSELIALHYGDFINIQCLPTHRKRKALGWAKEDLQDPENIPMKRCRVSGMGKSQKYGLVLYINPSGYAKGPFPLYLAGYGSMWVAYKENEVVDEAASGG